MNQSHLKSPFPKDTYKKNAEVYKILANPIRLEILNVLKSGECSVDKLTKILGLRKANVSQHLALLRHTKLVTQRKNGLGVYYSIVDPKIISPCEALFNLRTRGVI